MGVVDDTYRKPWRCRVLGHRYPNVVYHTLPVFTVFPGDLCSRCGWNRSVGYRFVHDRSEAHDDKGYADGRQSQERKVAFVLKVTTAELRAQRNLLDYYKAQLRKAHK